MIATKEAPRKEAKKDPSLQISEGGCIANTLISASCL